MSRSKWKGPYFDQNNLKALQTKSNTKKNIALPASRNSEITPACVGYTFKVHNGKSHFELNVTKDMIGHKFGEFVFTRAKFFFKKKRSKK